MPTSNDESTNTSTPSASQSLWREAWERVTEAIPASLGLPRLLAIDNLNKDQAILRAKIQDDHKRQMAAIDATTGRPIDLTDAEESVISVAGDTTTNVTNQGAGKLAAMVAAVSLPLAGIGIYKLLDDTPTVDPPPVVAPVEPGTDRDTYVPYDFGIE